MGRPEKIRLGESLVQQKLLTEEQLKAAIDEQQKTGRRLGRVCIERGLISEEQLSRALARQLGVDYIDLKHYNIKREVVARLPETQVRRFRAMVIEDRGEAYLVGMADPTDLAAYDEIARILKREIELVVVTESELLRTIDRIYRRTEEITGLAQELRAEIGDSGTVDFGALAITPGLDEAPVVKLLQTVFEDATQARASDIHIEPQERRLQIRFRIDRRLHDSGCCPRQFKRLVESAFAQAQGRQRHRQDQVGGLRWMLLEHFGERADGGQPAAVFTGLDQAIDGKTVTRGGNYLIKVRRVGKAAAADAGGG